MKGNRLGGTLCGAMELAMHLTGEYPDWWPGRKYDRAVLAWAGSVTTTTQREVVQKMLLGCEETDLKHPLVGTGAIPADSLIKITNRQAGVRNVIDQIKVHHVSGGESIVSFKTYEQGRSVLQGADVDICWPDEESKYDPMIYSEMLTRTLAIPDGMIYQTFSPLNGRTEVLVSFLEPEEGSLPKSVTTMTIWDAVGGEWAHDTPWAGAQWEGHFTKEMAEEAISAYKPHERDTRAYGIPMAGEGKVFTVPEEEIKCEPFEIPRHFRRINGIDFGINHYFAAVGLAHDADTDTIYVYKTFKSKGTTPDYHVPAIKAWGDWIPVAWPHDGMNREKGSGLQLYKHYAKRELKMLGHSARYEQEKGGAQGVEDIALQILIRMQTGRFKVFANLSDWFDEYRTLHRKGDVIQPTNDDVMKATFYAVMEIRNARPDFVQAVNMPNRPILKMWG